MDREIYKQRLMEADSTKIPIQKFQKIISDSIYPVTGPQRGYNNLLIAIEECAELIESFGDYISGKDKNKYGVYEELTDVHLCQYYVMNVLDIKEKDIELDTKHMTEMDVFTSLSKFQFRLAKYMRKAETFPEQERKQMVHQIMESLSEVRGSLLFLQEYMQMTKEELFKSINVVMNRQKNRNELQDPLGLLYKDLEKLRDEKNTYEKDY